jgi:hypothetical protein
LIQNSSDLTVFIKRHPNTKNYSRLKTYSHINLLVSLLVNVLPDFY